MATEAQVLNLLQGQNKPFGLQNLVDLLAHQGIKKAAIQKALDALAQAIAATNKAQFAPRFLELTRTCNACHVSAGVGFVVIETPRTSPFTNQSFAPAPK